jgi:hypothetical protein
VPCAMWQWRMPVLPIEECLTLRKFGSRLQGQPERLRLPGIETTSGPSARGSLKHLVLPMRFAWIKSQIVCTA